jgi:hypothetical protein
MNPRFGASLGCDGVLEIEDHGISATVLGFLKALGTIARYEQHRSHGRHSLQNGIKTPQVCHGAT